MNIKTYKAFQPLTVVDTENLKLVRFGDFYPTAEAITDPNAVPMEFEVELPEEVALQLGFEEVAAND